jgi:hypothetical protein
VESGSAVRTAIAYRSHDLFQRSDTGLWRGAGERVPPSLFTGPVPCIRICLVTSMPVMFAFAHGVLLDESPQSPSFKGSIGRPASRRTCLALRGNLHGGGSRIKLSEPIIPLGGSILRGAVLYPLFTPLGNERASPATLLPCFRFFRELNLCECWNTGPP